MHPLARLGAGCSLLALLLLTGCGGDAAGVLVSGTVLYDGQPLNKGGVTFQPAESKGGPAAAPVTDGRFTVRLVPAKYKITVTSAADTEATGPKTYDDMKSTMFDFKESERVRKLPKAERDKFAAKVKGGNQNIAPDSPGNNATMDVVAGQELTIPITKPKAQP